MKKRSRDAEQTSPLVTLSKSTREVEMRRYRQGETVADNGGGSERAMRATCDGVIGNHGYWHIFNHLKEVAVVLSLILCEIQMIRGSDDAHSTLHSPLHIPQAKREMRPVAPSSPRRTTLSNEKLQVLPRHSAPSRVHDTSQQRDPRHAPISDSALQITVRHLCRLYLSAVWRVCYTAKAWTRAAQVAIKTSVPQRLARRPPEITIFNARALLSQ